MCSAYKYGFVLPNVIENGPLIAAQTPNSIARDVRLAVGGLLVYLALTKFHHPTVDKNYMAMVVAGYSSRDSARQLKA